MTFKWNRKNHKNQDKSLKAMRNKKKFKRKTQNNQKLNFQGKNQNN